jgi:hypothetical protein
MDEVRKKQVLLGAVILVSACGIAWFAVSSGGPEGEGDGVTRQRTALATQFNQAYNFCWGKVERCPPESKKFVLDYAKSEQKAQAMFDRLRVMSGNPPQGPSFVAKPAPPLPRVGSALKG